MAKKSSENNVTPMSNTADCWTPEQILRIRLDEGKFPANMLIIEFEQDQDGVPTDLTRTFAGPASMSLWLGLLERIKMHLLLDCDYRAERE